MELIRAMNDKPIKNKNEQDPQTTESQYYEELRKVAQKALEEATKELKQSKAVMRKTIEPLYEWNMELIKLEQRKGWGMPTKSDPALAMLR